ncbi:hypothetical protein QBC41DRAFT_96514 [Cercophora samala]|uniref:Peptidase C14 caspase domain-containing protein n=1 Tax=Cercophora samala TaxID=330535 RepID=A0AA39ZFX9_9PEZI|nr:hypothetical protein QBC41DRAFT_96514 [Cercophora samala]
MAATNQSSDWLSNLNQDLETTVRYHGYAKVTTLVTYWEDGHPGFVEEGNDVAAMFRNTFNFDVTTFAIPSSDSYPALLKVVLECMTAKAPGPALFIVHYGGHGDRNDDRHNQEERRSVWAAHAQGGPTVKWYKIQDQIKEVRSETDMLLILDCCFAAQAGRGSDDSSGRLEILAAAAMGVKTPLPGPKSFTAAVIRNMKRSVAQDGFVVISELQYRLTKREEGLFTTPIYIGLTGGRSIRLEPINPNDEQPTNISEAKIFLQLLIKVKDELTDKNTKKISQWIKTSEVPNIVSGLELTFARTEQICKAVEDIRQGDKLFTRHVKTVDKDEILAAWNQVVSLVQEYHSLRQLQLGSNKQQQHQVGHFLEDLAHGTGDVLELLERYILTGPALEEDEALEVMINDDTLQALGLTGPLQLVKIARQDISLEAITTAPSDTVIQEKKTYGPYLDPRDIPVVEKRISVLANMLKAADSQDFRALRCIGWSPEPLEHCYILNFEVPHGIDNQKYVTLQHVIQKTKGSDRPSLDERLGLAFTLAKAVENWHLVGWLHQGISSFNIIFFRKPGTRRIEYSEPYLHGFEFARPGSDPSIGRAVDSIEFNVYRHPDRQGTVQRGHLVKHDIYSLGVVLLEIGLWQSALEIVRKLPSKSSGLEIQSYLMKQCDERLAHFAGESYQNVVATCFKSSYEVELDDAFGSRSAKSFHEKVVVKLSTGIRPL